MPFISEEIWQLISERKPENALIVSSWPEIGFENENLIKQFDFTTDVIAGIRSIRKEKNIAIKEQVDLFVLDNELANRDLDVIIKKLGNLSNLEYIQEKPGGALSFRVKSNEYFIPVGESVNIEDEIAKLKAELNYTSGFLNSVRKKLSNERFVNNAPEQVIKNERNKEADALAKISMLNESLKSLQD